MALTARYLAHTSALARIGHSQVQAILAPLLAENLVATCAIVDLEILYSARNLADYEALLAERRAFEDVPITPEVMARAIDVQGTLAQDGWHRVPIPDLMIAAAAESADLSILHYDRDFEGIASLTGQPHDWVVPAGTF